MREIHPESIAEGVLMKLSIRVVVFSLNGTFLLKEGDSMHPVDADRPNIQWCEGVGGVASIAPCPKLRRAHSHLKWFIHKVL